MNPIEKAFSKLIALDLRRRNPSKAQTGNERDHLVMPVRDGGSQSPSAPAASMCSSETDGSAGLVDEDKCRGIKIARRNFDQALLDLGQREVRRAADQAEQSSNLPNGQITSPLAAMIQLDRSLL
jgi:hypothetical protein